MSLSTFPKMRSTLVTLSCSSWLLLRSHFSSTTRNICSCLWSFEGLLVKVIKVEKGLIDNISSQWQIVYWFIKIAESTCKATSLKIKYWHLDLLVHQEGSCSPWLINKQLFALLGQDQAFQVKGRFSLNKVWSWSLLHVSQGPIQVDDVLHTLW